MQLNVKFLKDKNGKDLSEAHKVFLVGHLDRLDSLPHGKEIINSLQSYFDLKKKYMRVHIHNGDGEGTSGAISSKDGNADLVLNLQKTIQNPAGEYFSRIPAIKSQAIVNGLDVVEVGPELSPFFLTLGHELNHIRHAISDEHYQRDRQNPAKEDGGQFPKIPHLSLRRDAINHEYEERRNVFHHKEISDLSLTLQARARGENVPIRHIYQGANERYYETVDNVLAAAGDYAPQVQKYMDQLPKRNFNEQDLYWEYTPFVVSQSQGLSSTQFKEKFNEGNPFDRHKPHFQSNSDFIKHFQAARQHHNLRGNQLWDDAFQKTYDSEYDKQSENMITRLKVGLKRKLYDTPYKRKWNLGSGKFKESPF